MKKPQLSIDVTMKDSKEAYAPLIDEDAEENGSYLLLKHRQNRWFSDLWIRLVLVALLFISLSYNIFQDILLRLERARPDECRSKYTGLAYDTPMTYETNWGRNETEADAYWEQLDASPVIVTLDDKQAKEYDLGPSATFPWDKNRSMYYIKAFHHIHCLKIIRKTFKTYESGVPYLGDHEHLYHCINTLRQDIMCKPDDTLMPSEDQPHVIGDNQDLQCRNWDALVAWSKAPERNACYRIFDDDRPVAHKLEEYAFCHEQSPWYSTMKKYFEIHGHKPLYEDDFVPAGYPAKTTEE